MQSVSDELGEKSKITDEILQLAANVARLRSPVDGCPWFRRQTFQTLRRYLLEEVYEVLDPLGSESPEKLKEELGDLLFQIVTVSQLSSELDWFSLADVLQHLNEKIIHRNPHVFGEMRADTVEEAQRIWTERKSLEKMACENAVESPLNGLSISTPALALAQAYIGRCGLSNTGWTFPDPSLIFDVETQLASSQPDEPEVVLGRLLFMLVDLAGRHHLNAEASLQKINTQFREQVSGRFSLTMAEGQR